MAAMEFRAGDWDRYRMETTRPFEKLEPLENEKKVVGEGLAALRDAGILNMVKYDGEKFLLFRRAVAELFEIPWTAITPRMQRLLWAINAIHRPDNMIAAGVFCGNTFISNAGAAVGPGAVYSAKALVGLEIRKQEAERAERNVRRIDSSGVARVLAEDAVEFCANWRDPIDLLYLDADGDRGRGKGIYLEIAEKSWDKMPPGALLLAHNSVNGGDGIGHYLSFVRDRKNCRASVNMVMDIEGLEVSVK